MLHSAHCFMTIRLKLKKFKLVLYVDGRNVICLTKGFISAGKRAFSICRALRALRGS